MAERTLATTMRVPHFVGKGQIDIVDKAVPRPGPGELLIRVKANALCGSERGQFYNGSTVTPGHEAAGVVVAAGPGTHTQVGTSGVIFLMDFCGECRSCKLGMTNQCLHKRADMGFNKDGGYGNYELVHENIFFSVDADISATEATMLLDVMGTNGHGIKRARLVHPDIKSVIVSGAGPVGLGMVAMAKLLFGSDVSLLVSDISPYRLALAERLGGKPINLKEKTLEEGLRYYGLQHVDGAFDTSGKEAARRTCLTALAQRGVLVCIGHGEGLTVNVSPDLIATERAILGSEYFAFNELPGNLDLLRKNREYLSQIITHRMGVSDIQKAFELFYQGNTGKVIIEQ